MSGSQNIIPFRWRQLRQFNHPDGISPIYAATWMRVSVRAVQTEPSD